MGASLLQIAIRRLIWYTKWLKYDDPKERTAFLDWLEDFEFNKFALPTPDAVCLLDMPLEVSEALMAERTGKTGGNTGIFTRKSSIFSSCSRCL